MVPRSSSARTAHGRPTPSSSLLRRDPGGPFRELPAPPPSVLRAAGDPAPGDQPETLAADRGAGRVNVAVADVPGSPALLFDVPVGRDVEDAVLVHDGTDGPDAWTREPVVLPDAPASFTVAAIAADAPDHAWLVGASPGRPLRLFRRVTSPAPQWEEVALPAGPFTDPAAATTAGFDGIGMLGGRAQTLTSSGDDVWVDVKLTAGAVTTTGTLLIRPASPVAQRLESWCASSACDHPFDALLTETPGYRSFAWPGDGAGTRVVTNPLRPGGDERSGQGTFLALRGSAFVRRPGGGQAFQRRRRLPLGGPRLARAGPCRSAR